MEVSRQGRKQDHAKGESGLSHLLKMLSQPLGDVSSETSKIILSWEQGARYLYIHTDRSLNEGCPWKQSITFGEVALFSLGQFPEAFSWGLSVKNSVCNWRGMCYRGIWVIYGGFHERYRLRNRVEKCQVQLVLALSFHTPLFLQASREATIPHRAFCVILPLDLILVTGHLDFSKWG